MKRYLYSILKRCPFLRIAKLNQLGYLVQEICDDILKILGN